MLNIFASTRAPPHPLIYYLERQFCHPPLEELYLNTAPAPVSSVTLHVMQCDCLGEQRVWRFVYMDKNLVGLNLNCRPAFEPHLIIQSVTVTVQSTTFSFCSVWYNFDLDWTTYLTQMCEACTVQPPNGGLHVATLTMLSSIHRPSVEMGSMLSHASDSLIVEASRHTRALHGV